MFKVLCVICKALYERSFIIIIIIDQNNQFWFGMQFPCNAVHPMLQEGSG